jgi:hypothetical protein
MAFYQELVDARKRCTICISRDPKLIVNGSTYKFDPNVVSYWSQWLGNQHPDIVVVAQDFSNEEYFEKNNGHDENNNRTNEMLRHLLAIAGITVSKAPIPDRNAPIYLINSVLCLKTGGMDAQIRDSWVDSCADRHLRPLIGFLNPRIAVGMGVKGWRAVRRLYSLTCTPTQMRDFAGKSWTAANGTIVFGVGHCGPKGLASRKQALQEADWKRIGETVHHLSPRN